jgi:hypothetical protein
MSGAAGERRMVLERARLEQARLRDMSGLLREAVVVRQLGSALAAVMHQLVDQQQAAFAGFVGRPDEQTWTKLRERIRTGDMVLAECTAVVAGAFTRPLPLVGEACSEAQMLTTELSRLTGIAVTHGVIPADAECVNLASSVVRRRFPDHGVWDLPVVAHEFGHLVARDLLEVDLVSGDTSRPIAELLAGRQRQLAELASDVFAVHAIGAAYVLNLVLHRMDPTARAVSADDATHPGDASRVAAVLHVLALLGRSDIDVRHDQYDFVIQDLTAWWSEAQAGAPGEARLDENAAARVRRDAEKVWTRLVASRLAGDRYLSFRRAREMADAFRGGGTPDAGDASCRDVLNAAWLVRFRAWRDGAEAPDRLVPWARSRLRRTAATA